MTFNFNKQVKHSEKRQQTFGHPCMFLETKEMMLYNCWFEDADHVVDMYDQSQTLEHDAGYDPHDDNGNDDGGDGSGAILAGKGKGGKGGKGGGKGPGKDKGKGKGPKPPQPQKEKKQKTSNQLARAVSCFELALFQQFTSPFEQHEGIFVFQVCTLHLFD